MDNFPYRKYELSTSVKEKLSILLSAKPKVINKKWNIPDNKVVKRIGMDIYNTIDVVISSSITDHWDIDRIVDYYCEYARINSLGYGEKYSVYEYWKNKNLHKRWNDYNKNITDREKLYKKITEARPAYASVAISLYHYLSSLYLSKNKHIILDIAAYGERAIAAANLGYDYYGIDPNYDLIEGHTRLHMDLQCLKPDSDIKFYYVGLENYKSLRKFTIITYSPPPFNTEQYSQTNKELQTYSKYPTFIEYFCCFLVEIIYKASQVIVQGGIFSFTALDRNPKKFPPKIINTEYSSEHLELIYVEALLLVTSCFGFEYIGAIGLSVGDKDAQVPWWTFKYTKKYENKYIDLLYKNYNTIFDRVGSRLLTNYNDTALFNEYKIIEKYKFDASSIDINNNVKNYKSETHTFNISRYEINKTVLSYEQKIFMELCRLRIQEYICVIISNISNIHYNKIRTVMGRYLMMRSITGTYDEPWLSKLFVDPVFPTSYDNIEDINNYLISNLQEHNCKNAEYIVNSHNYWFNSYELHGISELYNCVANYMLTLPISKISLVIKKLFPNKLKIIGDENSIIIINNIPGNSLSSEILYEGQSDIGLDEQNIIIFLRYNTLAARGHQFTRISKRTEIIESIFNQKIIDIYASIYNNQSEKYCSIYPDIEHKAYGSAFNLQMIEGLYLANPVDNPVFLKYAINNILTDLEMADTNNKKLIICMSFTLWLDINPNFINNFNDTNIIELLQNTDNYGLVTLSANKYLRYVYILDKDKFPSVIKGGTVNNNSRNTISVGVILSSIELSIDEDNINKLAYNNKYKQIN